MTKKTGSGTNRTNQGLTSGPAVILVRPQLALNMGMVARAMGNMGLAQLILVDPREDHLKPEAIQMATVCADILRAAQVKATFEEALIPFQYAYATSARDHNLMRSSQTPEEAAQNIVRYTAGGARCALVFGPENSGLSNAEIAHTQGTIRIPANPARASLNLAQAVLIMGYAWLRASEASETALSNKGDFVTYEERSNLLFLLHRLLDQKGYYELRDKAPKMRQTIDNFFSRGDMTSQEATTLMGIFKRLGENS